MCTCLCHTKASRSHSWHLSPLWFSIWLLTWHFARHFWSGNVHISHPRLSNTLYHEAAIVQLLLLPYVHLQVSSFRTAKSGCYICNCVFMCMLCAVLNVSVFVILSLSDSLRFSILLCNCCSVIQSASRMHNRTLVTHLYMGHKYGVCRRTNN